MKRSAARDTETLLRQASELAIGFLDTLPSRHPGVTASHDELMRVFGAGPLSEKGVDPAQVIAELAGGAEKGLIASAGPRYFGFVIGGSLPVTVAADWLTSAWDQNSGTYSTSPAASVIEEIAGGWLLETLGLPSTAGVGFVTGCQMANYTCLSAARHSLLRRQGWDVEEKGLGGAPRVNIVLSAEAHVTIYSALRFLGFGTSGVHLVETDEQGRMRPDRLLALSGTLQGPTIVCAQAGNVNTGSFDPLEDVISIARESRAWVHVDGAFGLWAAASSDRAHLLQGHAAADSWATDAHKWLNVPYDCGLAIVRDVTAHRSAMTSRAAYLEQTAGAERDPFDWVPEFSRRGRGITVYAALRALGKNGVRDLVDRCCEHAVRMSELLRREKGVEILNDVVLNQVLIRFHATGKPEDELTRAIIARVQRQGTCWLGGTTWHGMAAMRISVSNWSTSEEDISQSAEAIVAAFRQEAGG